MSLKYMNIKKNSVTKPFLDQKKIKIPISLIKKKHENPFKIFYHKKKERKNQVHGLAEQYYVCTYYYYMQVSTNNHRLIYCIWYQ